MSRKSIPEFLVAELGEQCQEICIFEEDVSRKLRYIDLLRLGNNKTSYMTHQVRINKMS